MFYKTTIVNYSDTRMVRQINGTELKVQKKMHLHIITLYDK